MYCIIFVSLRYSPSPCDILGEIKEVWFEGYGLVLSDLLHESSSCMLLSWQKTLVTPQAHGAGFVPKIYTLEELLCSS